MENEQIQQQVDKKQELENNYLETIENMKKNTVSKEDYDHLFDEHKKLTQMLANGETLELNKEEAQGPSVDELRNKLFDEENQMTNLEYCQTALTLRNKILEEKKVDIFAPNSSQYHATEEDYRKAQNVADVMQECIDYAQGNPEVFTQELMRRTNDVRIPGVHYTR